MIQRTVRNLSRILASCIVFVILALSLLTCRIFIAPLQIGFLTSYLQKALNQDNNLYQLTLGAVLLYWAGWDSGIGIIARNTKIQTPDGQLVILLPAVSSSLSLTTPGHGLFIPRVIEIQNSHLYLRYATTDRLQLLNTCKPCTILQHDSTVNIAQWLVERIPTLLNHRQPINYLERVKVIGGTVTINDRTLGTTWIITDINLELTRKYDDTTIISGQLLLQTTDTPVPITLSGRHAPYEDRWLNLTVTFANLRPSALACAGIQAIANINLLISGILVAQLGEDGQLNQLGFSIVGGSGVITLPSPHFARYDVHSLLLEGTIGTHFRSLTLNKGLLDFGGPRLELAAAVVWILPTISVTTFGNINENKDRNGQQVILIGNKNLGKREQKRHSRLPTLPPGFRLPSIIVQCHRLLSKTTMSIIAAANFTLRGFPLDRLMNYWPTGIAVNPRSWIATSLHDGVISQAHFTVDLVGGPDIANLVVNSWRGELTVHNVTIDYFNRMPPIRHANADVIFHKDRVEVTMDRGNIHNLRFANAKVAITGLNQLDQICTIDMTITGPVADVLRLVDNYHLNYVTTLGICPKQISGSAIARLTLTFPIEKHLTLKQVDFKARARLFDLTIASLVFGHDLTHGDFSLEVDDATLHVAGYATIANTPVSLDWHESFYRRPASVRRRYTVRGCFNDAQRSVLGLNFPPFVPPYLRGPAQINLAVTMDFDGSGTLTVESDLVATAIALPNIGWAKLPGQPATATGLLHFTTNTVHDVPHFALHSGRAVNIVGHASFTQTGLLDRITFEHFQIGRTDLRGTLSRDSSGSLTMYLAGASLDCEQLKLASASFNGPTLLPNLALELIVARLWEGQRSFLTNTILTARLVDGVWYDGSLNASIGYDGVINATFKREHGSPLPTYSITVISDEAGVILSTFGLFDNMVGGRMDAHATLDSNEILRGTVQIENYRLVNAPLLARLLTVAALTGILEFLTDDGIHFTNFDMPFIYHDGILFLTDFHTSGPSLGLTARGKLFLKNEQIAINGAIVPIYAINSLVSHIPLLGELIAGGKGGGLFAATYTMSGNISDPVVTVNPLTVIAPGFLRNFLRSFNSSNQDDISSTIQSTIVE